MDSGLFMHKHPRTTYMDCCDQTVSLTFNANTSITVIFCGFAQNLIVNGGFQHIVHGIGAALEEQ